MAKTGRPKLYHEGEDGKMYKFCPDCGCDQPLESFQGRIQNGKYQTYDKYCRVHKLVRAKAQRRSHEVSVRGEIERLKKSNEVLRERLAEWEGVAEMARMVPHGVLREFLPSDAEVSALMAPSKLIILILNNL